MIDEKKSQAIIELNVLNIKLPEEKTVQSQRYYFVFGVGELCQHEYTAPQDYPFLLIQPHAH